MKTLARIALAERRKRPVPWVRILLLIVATALQAEGQGESPGSALRTTPTTIPFELVANQPLIPVRVDGSEPLWFSLDSGASSMILDPVRAKELGLPLAETLRGSGAGAGAVMYTKIARPVDIQVGGLKSEGHSFITIDLSGVSANIGHRMDGILGYEFFARFIVTVDYQKRVVVLVRPDSFKPSGGGAILPIEFRRKVPFIRGELKVPGVPAEESRFLVDSGSGDAVDHPLIKQSKGKVVDTTAGVGLGTPIPGYIGRAEYFKLGPYRMDGPITACCGSNELNEKMIGGEVLRRFRVTFDYPHQRLILKPNRELHSAFAYDSSGLDIEAAESGKAFRIRNVTAESPASEADVRIGDMILAIDGVPVSKISITRAVEMFMRPGRTHALGVRRGDSTFKVKIKLRAII